MWVLQKGHSGDGCDLASSLCKYVCFMSVVVIVGDSVEMFVV